MTTGRQSCVLRTPTALDWVWVAVRRAQSVLQIQVRRGRQGVTPWKTALPTMVRMYACVCVCVYQCVSWALKCVCKTGRSSVWVILPVNAIRNMEHCRCWIWQRAHTHTHMLWTYIYMPPRESVRLPCVSVFVSYSLPTCIQATGISIEETCAHLWNYINTLAHLTHTWNPCVKFVHRILLQPRCSREMPSWWICHWSGERGAVQQMRREYLDKFTNWAICLYGKSR